jgi:hypothetical protein
MVYIIPLQAKSITGPLTRPHYLSGLRPRAAARYLPVIGGEARSAVLWPRNPYRVPALNPSRVPAGLGPLGALAQVRSDPAETLRSCVSVRPIFPVFQPLLLAAGDWAERDGLHLPPGGSTTILTSRSVSLRQAPGAGHE